MLLFSGLVSIYCFWLMLASASFWLVRINEVQELFDGLFRAGQYPVGIYPGWLRYGLTFIVPLAFADHRAVRGGHRAAGLAVGRRDDRLHDRADGAVAVVLEARLAPVRRGLGLAGRDPAAALRLRPRHARS